MEVPWFDYTKTGLRSTVGQPRRTPVRLSWFGDHFEDVARLSVLLQSDVLTILPVKDDQNSIS